MSSPTQDVPGAVAQFLDDVAERAQDPGTGSGDRPAAPVPWEHPTQPADRLVKSFSTAGLGGAATGALSLLSLPLGLPAGVALTLGLEAELLLALLEVYEMDTSGSPGRLKLYALWAGSGLADAAKSVGLVMGAEALAEVLAGTLPVRLISRLNPALVRFVLKRLGLSWMPRVLSCGRSSAHRSATWWTVPPCERWGAGPSRRWSRPSRKRPPSLWWSKGRKRQRWRAGAERPALVPARQRSLLSEGRMYPSKGFPLPAGPASEQIATCSAASCMSRPYSPWRQASTSSG